MLASDAAAAGASGTAGSEAALRGRLVSLLQSRDPIEDLPPVHPLRPLAEAPILATFSCLLLEDDHDALARFYPRIAAHVHRCFAAERSTPAGFVRGTPLDPSGPAHPGINALAAIELHSLSRIAAAAGRDEDAIELRSWSNEFARSVHRYFYDYAAGIFMPVGPDGLFESVYLPDQLLPFAAGRSIGPQAAGRAAQRIFHETTLHRSEPRTPSLWDDPLMRPLVASLLSGVDGIPREELAAVVEASASRSSPREPAAEQGRWIAFWSDSAGALARLRPPDDDIFILRRLHDLLGREQLLLPDLRAPFAADIDSVSACLSAPSLDLERHIAATAAVNRLLAAISSTAGILEQGERVWKVFDEYRWDRLSPRLRKLIVESHRLSIEDLMAAKRTLSATMMKTTGIVAQIRLPDRPVPAGLEVDIEALIRSERAPLRIDRGFLQAAGNRWEIVRQGETHRLLPQAGPSRWTRTLPLPPGTEAGLVPVDAFLDLLVDGRRVELHLMESFTLTMGFDVTINFPDGRRIDRARIPLTIALKHPPGTRMQGSVRGATIEGISFDPGLPARFAVREGSGITNLPLEIDASEAASPGRYPLSLSVLVDGAVVANFDETLVVPIRWLHLGPMSGGSRAIENAVPHTDDMLGMHEIGDGNAARWRRVPAGALDASGAVLPGRLYGNEPGRSMLIYTVLTAKTRSAVRWSIETASSARLWINGVPMTSPGVEAHEGVTVLREGNNTVLLASSWDERPERILFEVCDDGGLPLAGLTNPVDEVIADLARRFGETPDISPAVMSDQPREVTFALEYPGAREVSLIGEFNSWEPEAAPMRLLGGQMWRVNVCLPPGTYTYKFLVDRKLRIADPRAAAVEPDGFGGLNSVITVK
ncbi:MAG: isoamylase early set domain-containing protein [Candidatus Krumholzibacteria bacterium]|nr:isoamylase early set domain-containing protein [Candidatus Krumholzibacteria bacterium]